MDKDQARFILRSYRPDGADAEEADFAEALQLAVEDRELCEWFAAERAFDAAVSKAIQAVAVPANLRDQIFEGLFASQEGLPQAEDAGDAEMIGAFASIPVPAGLRCELIATMNRAAAATAVAKRPRREWWRRAAIPAAAAAGICLALWFTRDPGIVAPVAITGAPVPVPVELMEAGFIRTFESPFLWSMDDRREEPGESIRHLEERKLPCAKLLPPGLQGVKSVGCREMMIDGKLGSLICFDAGELGVVHMVTFNRKDVCGDLPGRSDPKLSQCGPWGVAQWADDRHVYLLLGATEADRLKPLF